MPFKNNRQKNAGRRSGSLNVNKRKRLDDMGQTSKRSQPTLPNLDLDMKPRNGRHHPREVHAMTQSLEDVGKLCPMDPRRIELQAKNKISSKQYQNFVDAPKRRNLYTISILKKSEVLPRFSKMFSMDYQNDGCLFCNEKKARTIKCSCGRLYHQKCLLEFEESKERVLNCAKNLTGLQKSEKDFFLIQNRKNKNMTTFQNV